MIRWTAQATIRTTHRVEEPTTTALTQFLAARDGLTRSSGAPGLCVRFAVPADTHATAYGLALEVLATDVLPLVEGASLTDLRVVAGHLSPRPSAASRP
jgi:hypothetical protein